jgi:hypothetical protein
MATWGNADCSNHETLADLNGAERRDTQELAQNVHIGGKQSLLSRGVDAFLQLSLLSISKNCSRRLAVWTECKAHEARRGSGGGETELVGVG